MGLIVFCQRFAVLVVLRALYFRVEFFGYDVCSLRSLPQTPHRNHLLPSLKPSSYPGSGELVTCVLLRHLDRDPEPLNSKALNPKSKAQNPKPYTDAKP